MTRKSRGQCVRGGHHERLIEHRHRILLRLHRADAGRHLLRIAAVIGTMAVVLTYLIAQMVGAGTLIKLLFDLNYTLAIIVVGCVMMAYVLFGGMLATTWVQIIKACLLLGGAVVMAGLVLAQF